MLSYIFVGMLVFIMIIIQDFPDTYDFDLVENDPDADGALRTS
jgi:hypothetical protein